MNFNEELLIRAQDFAAQHGLTIAKDLGFGVHGAVFMTEGPPDKDGTPSQSAVKALRRETDYCRERDVYMRLQRQKVTQVRGSHVPQLLRYDDLLLILEMTVVTRPFLLDFGGAYLDRAPDFSEEVMADWRADKIEQFGKRWPEVQMILAVLETYGVFMEDVHPGNIAFADTAGTSSSS